MRSMKARKAEHDRYHEFKYGDFDYFCVAHEPDYSPKYLEVLGEDCHGMLSEGFCSDNCHLCPQECPFKPCPYGDEEDA